MNKQLFWKKAFSCMLIALMLLSFCALAEEPTVPVEITETEEGAELTEDQRAALDNLPEGFSRSVVAAEMMQSKACRHTDFYVWDEDDNDSYVYEYIDRGTHSYTYRIVKRHLYCSLCGKLLQTIDADQTVTGTTYHWWDNSDTSADNIFHCDECNTTIKVNWPCKHKELFVSEDANAYCGVCGAVVVLNSTQYYCDHSNRTVYYPNKTFVSYSQWNDEQHVKNTYRVVYEDLSWGIDADCNDCGIWIVCDTKGNIDYCGNTDRISWETEGTSAFENHKFSGGVCACGFNESDAGEKNPTHYSISLKGSTVTLTPDKNIVKLDKPMLIVNWAYTLRDGTAFSYTRLIKADDLSTLTYDLGLAEAPIGSKLESTTVIITDENTLDITVAIKGYGFAQF